MPQLVACIDATGDDIALTLMSMSDKESGSERMLVSELVNAAAADKSLPVRRVTTASHSNKPKDR